MRISVTNPDHLRNLVHFLRVRGCIAYATEDSQVIEAFRARSSGAVDEGAIRDLVEAWLAANPTAAPWVEADERGPGPWWPWART